MSNAYELAGLQWPPERSDDLVNFFAKKGQEDSFYKDSAGYVQTIIGYMREVASAGARDEDTHRVLPLISGDEDGKIYLGAFNSTPANTALMETIYDFSGAVCKFSDVSDDTGKGMSWWQGRHFGMPLNFVELRYDDEGGRYLHWLVSSTDPVVIEPQRTYSDRDLRAIKVAQTMQKVALKDPHRAIDQQLDYYSAVIALPTTDFESPGDD